MQRPKQRSKYNLAPVRDFRSKVREIVNRVSCVKHTKRVGQPCWWIHSDGDQLFPSICSARVSQVYNGQIDPKSVSTKRPKKEFTR